MTTASLFFGGDISQNYEDYLGPFLFEPYAIDLAARLNLTGVGRVLELACGSGRLTKHIAETLPPGVEFTATDLNVDMISVAKSKVSSDRVIWAPADMLDLPFESGSFDLVVCQFGIMLVPDQLKALAEIFRVLKVGGKVVFNTWSDVNYNRVWAIADSVLKSVLGKSMIGQNPGPFAMGDKDPVLDMLKKTGFSETNATLVESTGEIESAGKAAYGFIYGLPVGSFIQKEGPDSMPEILKVLEEILKSELGDQPLKAPMAALVFESTK
jgi:ubiquinone/menaquinone biosynthesis C-methylase UbiE